jgi:hypothetical protein
MCSGLVCGSGQHQRWEEVALLLALVQYCRSQTPCVEAEASSPEAYEAVEVLFKRGYSAVCI